MNALQDTARRVLSCLCLMAFLGGCASQPKVDCDAKLQPINAPAAKHPAAKDQTSPPPEAMAP